MVNGELKAKFNKKNYNGRGIKKQRDKPKMSENGRMLSNDKAGQKRSSSRTDYLTNCSFGLGLLRPTISEP